MMSEGTNSELKRSLHNRHIQMIALGGVIGTGLFYGSTEAIQLAGPATTLAYALGGLVIYFIMRMLGEMLVEEPVSGAFSFFAYKYWGGFAGFMAGWNYWFLYILASMAQLTVIGLYLDYWVQIDHGVSAFVILICVTLLNLVNVRLYGEFEFGLALVKVLAVIGMMIFGIFLIVTGIGGERVGFSNLWEHGGFFPNGLVGMFLAACVLMFSFCGTELVGVAAGETLNPQKTIPEVIRTVMWQVMFFYVGSIGIIMMIMPWDVIGTGESPFVSIFRSVGVPAAGHVVNFIVIMAAISVYNSGLYSNGRMLYSLATQGNAPRIFGKLNSDGVPCIAVLFSSSCTALIIVINSFLPDNSFARILAITTAAAAITWATIVIVHLKFRKAHKGKEGSFSYAFGLYPYANYFCLGFLSLLFCVLFASGLRDGGLMTQLFDAIGVLLPSVEAYIPEHMSDMSLAVLVMPVWCLLMFVGYKLKR
ncbi:Phenylalanine-specific permease [Bartonella ancashensis]|uniref:Phenylalanine-specific permease n=2 Tax=Bartonella ancashensis TaxID=1318743 RepID=A0A0M3T2X0_9HYPH|nr:Phenylalanine-specific permease [Bartonella ancashensis]